MLFCTCHMTHGQDRSSRDISSPKRETFDALVLEKRVREASGTEVFRPPSTVELRDAERLFARTFRGDESIEVLRDAWAKMHFALQTYGAGDQRIWLLRELPSHEMGRGFYAFRPAATMPVILEAPHSFADRNTRRLTAQLFMESPCAAAVWNTLHRKVVDTAHADSCFLNAFTRAFLRVRREDATICQLHGFAREKRTTRAGRTSDIIVSNGSKFNEFWLYRTVLSWRKMCPETVVRLYPDEVSELGATTNRQARLVREIGVGRFLHLEMSAEYRASLIDSPTMQSELLKILECALRTQSSGYTESEGLPEDARRH